MRCKVKKQQGDEQLIRDLSFKIWDYDQLLRVSIELKLWSSVLLIVAELNHAKSLSAFTYKGIPLSAAKLQSLANKAYKRLVQQKYIPKNDQLDSNHLAKVLTKLHH